MTRLFFVFASFALLMSGCVADNTAEPSVGLEPSTTLTLSIAPSRTTIGNKVEDTYPAYWSEGDCIAINGACSQEAVIDLEDKSRAQFTFEPGVSHPYVVTYPYVAGTTTSSPKVVFAAEQNYVAGGTESNILPMCGYSANATESITLKHLAGILRFSLTANKENISLSKVIITSSSAQLAGEFAVNCTTGAITPKESSSNSVTYHLPIGFTLSTTKESIFYVAIPAGEVGACTVKFIEASGDSMTLNWNPSTKVKAGVVREFKSVKYIAGTVSSLPDFEIDNDYFMGLPMAKGIIRSSDNRPLAGVVVSDGETCTQTDKNGFYQLDCDFENAKFIMASIPSGYKAQNNENGLPQFFHRITDEERTAGSIDADFTFDPIAGNPNRYTLIIGADPQPRAKSKDDDKVAFHSLDICENLYRDMRETRAAITDREVYGMMLGDIVHENMSLYTNYVAGLKTLNFQMFNIIGNHDHDLSATTDVEGARCFEENFGPSYYSFNIGKLHYVVLDNIIMAVINGKVQQTGYAYGLTDKEWTWLQNDLKYVDKSTTLMVASHCPMFKKDSAKAEFQDQSTHGTDYANLLKQYNKVHAWAGHTHRSFNYNYPSSNTLKNIEVHTLARSTGEFWTNEWNAYGTPRGYTIVEVDGDNISWKFKPTIYQAEFVGNNYSTVGTPSYTYRDWNYNEDGVAIMKDSGKILDSSYQIKAWKEGYYVYANVFMWDDKWETPKYNGLNMSIVSRTSDEAEDYAYKELCDFYSVNSILSGYSSYDYTLPLNYHNSIFRRITFDSSGSGTISVKDRFGNTYTADITW